MQKLLYTLVLVIFVGLLNVSAQKKFIKRKVAQKNYEGYLLLQEKKYAEALTYFNEAISEDPEAFFIYQNRAICRLELNDTTGAISDFKTNIRLEPENTESKYALGNIYKKQADSINASIWFEQAIAQADNGFSQTKLLYMNNFLGNYYRAAEKYDSAVICYNRVKIYDPQNSSVFINSAVCYFQLDSLDRFCNDLERAFVLGGNVNCIALKSYCNGCSHLIDERGGKVDTLSMVLDTRLRKIIPDTVFLTTAVNRHPFTKDLSKTIRVYFNEYWQISLPENASYYREAFWAKRANYFGGEFNDYYADGSLLAKGRIESTRLQGPFISYYPNGEVNVNGEFAKGLPIGKWKYFHENGNPDFEIEFILGEYSFNFIDSENPNFELNSGNGNFSILLGEWKDASVVLEGELKENQKTGNWKYIQNGETLILDVYKKGIFKRGYIQTAAGRLNTTSPVLDATFFTPPYLLQVRYLYFESETAAQHYSFIRLAK